MSLFESALRARMPLIHVSTKDNLNVHEIVSYLTGGNAVKVIDWEKKTVDNTIAKYMIAWDSVEDIQKQYETLVEQDKTLILVNCDFEYGVGFDAGILPTPPELVKRHLQHIVEEEDMGRIMDCLGGLTLKEVAEVCRIAMSDHGSLDPHSIMSVRRMLTSSVRGVSQVSTDMQYYVEDGGLYKWVKINKPYFLKCDEPMLIPRGLLLYGEPGVGKTQGAKFIARELEVPLYHLDIGSILGKYIGDSEGQMNQALAQLDQEQPCVVLIDEIEKIFKSTDDSGVTSRLLARLLWWLQEHTSRVLTIMTSNDIEALPPELYRSGRIDQTFSLSKLSSVVVKEFTHGFLSTFKEDSIPAGIKHITNRVMAEFYGEAEDGKYMSHSDLVNLIINVIKTDTIK